MNETLGEGISGADSRWRVAKASSTTQPPFGPRVVGGRTYRGGAVIAMNAYAGDGSALSNPRERGTSAMTEVMAAKTPSDPSAIVQSHGLSDDLGERDISLT